MLAARRCSGCLFVAGSLAEGGKRLTKLLNGSLCGPFSLSATWTPLLSMRAAALDCGVPAGSRSVLRRALRDGRNDLYPLSSLAPLPRKPAGTCSYRKETAAAACLAAGGACIFDVPQERSIRDPGFGLWFDSARKQLYTVVCPRYDNPPPPGAPRQKANAVASETRGHIGGGGGGGMLAPPPRE
uniref:Uncharacterized protein n=1 Tax=Ixodes ricinus TaxID=34613 RepID=A0A6B0V0S6_IXORI